MFNNIGGFRKFIKLKYSWNVWTTIRKHERIVRKIARYESHLEFLSRCKEENVIPNILKFEPVLLLYNEEAKLLIEETRKKLLVNQIKGAKIFLNKLCDDEEIFNRRLHRCLDDREYSQIMNWHHISFTKLCKNLRLKKMKKLNYLIGKIPIKQDYVINLSSHVISDRERMILNKGLNFAYDSNKNFNIETVAVLDQVWNKIEDQNQRSAFEKEILKFVHKKTLTTNLNDYEKKLLMKLKKNESIQVCLSDKGNNIVIVDTTDYVIKLDEVLQKGNYSVLNEDPTVKLYEDLKKFGSEMKAEGVINERLRRQLLRNSSNTPSIEARIKTHKSDFPARPIVNSMGAPTQNLARYLNQIVKKIKLPNEEYIAKNSGFVKKLISEKMMYNKDRFLMYKLDVKEMYTNVPVTETLHLLESLVFQQGEILTEYKMNSVRFMKLINFVMDNTYFRHKGIIYRQGDGFPMGSPLSGSLVNIYLNNLENRIIKDTKQKLIYCRYVDDILTIWFGTARQFDCFLSKFNKANKNLNFIPEKEVDRKLEYLDLVLVKNEEGNNLIFKFYKKQFQSDHMLNWYSGHSIHIKRNIVQNQLKRLKNICTNKDDLDKEIDCFKDRLIKNGYKIGFINEEMERFHKLEKEKVKNVEQVNTKNLIILPYLNKNTFMLKNICCKYGFKVVINYKHKLKQLVCKKFNYEYDVSKMMGIVYKLKCKDCNRFYLGQSRRMLMERAEEHDRYIRLAQYELSEMATHCHLHNHQVDDEMEVIYIDQDESRRQRVEALFIDSTSNVNLNRNEGTPFNKFFGKIIENEILSALVRSKKVKMNIFNCPSTRKKTIKSNC